MGGTCSSSANVKVGSGLQASQVESIIFVLGGPGSGKGTQCARICENFGYTSLSTGDLFRNEVKQDSDRAKEVQRLMSEGKLIPIDITLEILADAVQSTLATGGPVKLLLDGFPRELDQVHAFQKKFGRGCDFALYFEADDQTLVARCLERGKTSGRSDDNEESLKGRIETYHSKSRPVVEHFRAADKLKTVNAGQDIADVWKDVQAIFKSPTPTEV
ncbi:uncharacterized protein MONBRDRAFT_19069, partial [Monosiga brevicollis MX1]